MRPRDPARRSMPIEEWPPADRDAWAILVAPGDILGERGAGATWAAGTRKGVMQSYGHWLTWLSRSMPDRVALPVAARVTPENVAAWIAHLQTTIASVTVALRVQHLRTVVSGAAPDRDWDWLRRIVRRLERRVQPVRAKRDRLIGADEIYARGAAMMATALQSETPVWQDAQLFRDGLMLALLVSRPLRMRNFHAIEIDRHLCRRGTGFELRFAGNETKTGQEIEAAVPDALAPSIHRYLDVYRPLLRSRAQAPAPTSLLWICRKGTPMERAAVYCRIVTLSQREFGVRINPHLFRDCAATSIALEDPEHVRITRHILGHGTLRTSERHYNHASAVQAAARYQKHMLALRRQAAARTPRRRHATEDARP